MAGMLSRRRMVAALAQRAEVDAAELAMTGEPVARCPYSVLVAGVRHGCDLEPGHGGRWHGHFWWAGSPATLTWATGAR